MGIVPMGIVFVTVIMEVNGVLHIWGTPVAVILLPVVRHRVMAVLLPAALHQAMEAPPLVVLLPATAALPVLLPVALQAVLLPVVLLPVVLLFTN